MGSLLDCAPLSPRLRVHGSPPSRELPEHPHPLHRSGNDQQTIVHHKNDRTDFLQPERLGQDILPQRWRSAKSSNDPTCDPGQERIGELPAQTLPAQTAIVLAKYKVKQRRHLFYVMN
jgi:hypothetical protein